MSHYTPSLEIVMYEGMDDFDDKLEYLLSDDAMRADIGRWALERTLKEHLYRHRVEKLVQIMKERCGL